MKEILTGRPKYVFFGGHSITIRATVDEDERFRILTSRGDPGARRRGVVAFRGVVPGESLSISVNDIQLDEVVTCPVLETSKPGAWKISRHERRIERGRIQLGDGLTLPVSPSVGCLGLAPRTPAGGNPGRTGGNMDVRDLRTGAMIYLSAEHAGGLLAAGDLHAWIPDGEFLGEAVEATGSAELSFHREPGLVLKNPIIQTPELIVSVGAARTFGTALRRGLCGLTAFMVQRHGLLERTALVIASAAMEVRCGAVWPLYRRSTAKEVRSVVCAVLDRRLLPQ